MNGPQVTRLSTDQEKLHDFEVSLGGGYVYRVSVPDHYYRKLTGGIVPAEELVKNTFEFLLMREGPESILREFELPLVNQYFPEYEEEMIDHFAAQ